MKAYYLVLLLVSGLLLGNSYAFSQPRMPETKTGFEPVRWAGQNFAAGKVPPFSFTYGGKESKSFITAWEFSASKLPQSDPSVQNMQFSWRDRKTGFTATCLVTCFLDYPAIEWVVKFKNGQGQNSLLLEKVKAIDYSFRYETEGPVTLYHSRGSSGERSDFQESEDLVGAGRNIRMTPSSGRSSNNTAFPFFNVSMPGNQGVLTAIGWSGKWYADVKQADTRSWSLEAGMERMKLVLYPDEEIRTPLICQLHWQGEDRLTGHNLFRQFVLQHHSRQINGKFAELPLAYTLTMGGPPPCDLYNCSTESFCIAMTQRHQQFNLLPEVFWIDAGWFTGCGEWWYNAGNWTVEKSRFPNGLKPVSDAVHKTGARFLLWFEPERVVAGTMFDRMKPEFLIKIPDTVKNPDIGRFLSDMYLFDLGNPAACQWLTDYISAFIRENGVDVYRQDMNFDPMPYWKYIDKPDRIGISEIRYITGLYAYWDGLLRNFPNLIIDNCAGGGRRLDLETVSRSSPLWVTDYNPGEPNGYQCHTYGLNLYLPLHGTCCIVPTKYAMRSGMSSALAITWDINASTVPLSRMDSLMKDFKRLRPYYYGDYYPLVPNVNITSDSIWMAYQQNRPDQGDGIILAFRRPDCPTDKLVVKPRGLKPDSRYQLLFEDTGSEMIKTGAELMKGLELECMDKPGSLLISYQTVATGPLR
ncbi:MAG TPA: alpha-galactosidase [Bacteroidales bacterium]|nr:alpha-galactosidase [Bacteroidales bacterium]